MDMICLKKFSAIKINFAVKTKTHLVLTMPSMRLLSFTYMKQEQFCNQIDMNLLISIKNLNNVD